MTTVKAHTVLPDALIREIQLYIQGETIYIPKKDSSHAKWGSQSGTRKRLDERNAAIRASFEKGRTILQLADEYFLSIESIKKIVYKK
ncbi:CD3324 family protein [Chungangia koreensis]|uniref:CD3324 family protein n=1 Tax=Chungangia koreensis TaxID=752657 RepID=A0ABV8X339_9LACT